MDIMDPGRIELRVVQREARIRSGLVSIGLSLVIVAVAVAVAAWIEGVGVLACFAAPMAIVWLVVAQERRLQARSPLWWVLVGEGGRVVAFTADGRVAGATEDGSLELRLAHYFHHVAGQGGGFRAAVLVRVRDTVLPVGCEFVKQPREGPQIDEPPCELQEDDFRRLLALVQR